MLRFAIRDVLWLTVVVALAVGWWSESRRAVRLLGENQALNRSHEMMREAIEILEEQQDSVLTGEPQLIPIYADDSAHVQILELPLMAD